MNNVNLIGRLTRDPEARNGQNTMVCSFTLAVNRPFSKEKEADFIRCVSFGKTAEIADRYLMKGREAGVTGWIKTGSYDDKDGKKVYTTDVMVERLDLIGGRPDRDESEGFREYRDDDDLPF